MGASGMQTSWRSWHVKPLEERVRARALEDQLLGEAVAHPEFLFVEGKAQNVDRIDLIIGVKQK